MGISSDNKAKKRRLYIINHCYPHNHVEDSFIGMEIPSLSEAFDITLISTEVKDESLTDEEKSMYVISPSNNVVSKIFSAIKALFSKIFIKEIVRIIKERDKVLPRCMDALMYFIAADCFFKKVYKRTNLKNDKDALLYFYWYDFRCLGFVINRNKIKFNKMVARTHGYELYDERERYGLQFYKECMDRNLEKVIFAAEYARNYYLNRYQLNPSEKYSLHRLGVKDYATSNTSRKDDVIRSINNNEFTILSCSNVIDIKRIELIIEGLSLTNNHSMKLKWIHIGSGDRLEMIKELAKNKLNNKANLSYEFPGFLTNQEVIKVYQSNCIGAFITTTSTEGGSPVSIQEALSFGVPVIGTRIGEIPLMIEKSGYVLNSNPDGNEVATAIDEMLDIYGSDEYFDMCSNALDTFQSMFNIDTNNKSIRDELCAVI